MDAPGGPDPAFTDALAQIATLQHQLSMPQHVETQLSSGAVRLRDELAAMLAALRPDLVLLRVSLLVVVGEFGSRVGFYRALRELLPSGGRPDGWKLLRGTERWWERHVPTGHDNAGRAYARFDTQMRQWALLLSWKAEQDRDIVWLRQQP